MLKKFSSIFTPPAPIKALSILKLFICSIAQAPIVPPNFLLYIPPINIVSILGELSNSIITLFIFVITVIFLFVFFNIPAIDKAVLEISKKITSSSSIISVTL